MLYPIAECVAARFLLSFRKPSPWKAAALAALLFGGSATTVSAQAVVPAASTTLLSLSSEAVVSGSPVTLTATVAVGSQSVTTGQVTFLDGLRVLGFAQIRAAGPN